VPICAFGFGCLRRSELIFNGIHFGNSLPASMSESQNSTPLARSIWSVPTISSETGRQPITGPRSEGMKIGGSEHSVFGPYCEEIERAGQSSFPRKVRI